MMNPLECLICIEGHVALDRNPGPGYNTLLLRLIQDLSACPHRQFHTLPGLLESPAALSNCLLNTCMLCREAVCPIFMVFGVTLATQTHNLPHGSKHAYHLVIPPWSISF